MTIATTVAHPLPRAELRQAVFAVLFGAGLNLGGRPALVVSPGIWGTPPAQLPAVRVIAPTTQYEAAAKGIPNFNLTCVIEVEMVVGANLDTDAQTALELFEAQVVAAICTCPTLQSLANLIRIEQEGGIDKLGKLMTAGSVLRLHFELLDVYDAYTDTPPPQQPIAVPLTSVGFHADMANVFDQNGTYTGSPFASDIAPAPRNSGPDGRDEGALDINLPQ